MKKRDLILIAGVLILALALFGIISIRSGGTAQAGEATVSIYVHDELYASVPISAYQSITVDQGDGKVNVITIDETGVYMKSSTCKNQICVDTGVIDPAHLDDLLLENWIVCLPNGVSVEVGGSED